MTEDEEYANAGISKDAAESSGEKSDDEWVEDAEGNFVRKDKK